MKLFQCLSHNCFIFFLLIKLFQCFRYMDKLSRISVAVYVGILDYNDWHKVSHQIEKVCYRHRGEANCGIKDYDQWYSGDICTTRSGIKCQAWSEQYPHRHGYTPEKFLELRNSKNYCRNPGNLEIRPWCYTTHKHVRWQYCRFGEAGELCGVCVCVEDIDWLIVTWLYTAQESSMSVVCCMCMFRRHWLIDCNLVVYCPRI